MNLLVYRAFESLRKEKTMCMLTRRRWYELAEREVLLSLAAHVVLRVCSFHD